MCIIVYKPRNVAISLDTLKTCFEHNSHGAGFMYPCENKVLIKKGYFTFSDFAKAWEISHKIHGNSIPVVFHFRISTSGRIDKTNCHPHRIAEDLAFVHNGILSCVTPSRKSKVSDTILYRDAYLKNFSGKSLKNQARFERISSHIGQNNKFVFMNGQGGVAICNADQGIWNEEIWFSKSSFQKVTYKTHLFSDDVCECCGIKLTDPEEMVNGICAKCLPLYLDAYDECAKCGASLTTSAEWNVGYCNKCATTVYGMDWDWEFHESAGRYRERYDTF